MNLENNDNIDYFFKKLKVQIFDKANKLFEENLSPTIQTFDLLMKYKNSNNYLGINTYLSS